MAQPRWMGNLSEHMKDFPLIQMAIPGSHDAMSYTCHPANGFSPDADSKLEMLRKWFYATTAYESSVRVLKIVYNWCITQDMEVIEQLRWGIRYLDFRVAKKPSDGQFYFCHGLYGGNVSVFLPLINNFLEENPEEVVICDFQHLYGFEEEDHLRFIYDYIRTAFGSKMCPYTNPREWVTIKWMLEKGFRVIVIYRHLKIEKMYMEGIWPGWGFITNWPKTNKIEVMRDFNDEKLRSRDMTRGLITQMILTPTAWDVIWHPEGKLKAMVIPVHDKLRKWLDSKRAGENQGQVNVIMADFVGSKMFCSRVLKLNEPLSAELDNYYLEEPDSPY